jgi:hypothetical protein
MERMSLRELCASLYAAAVDHRFAVLAGALALPLVGTLAARVGKAGRSDADGRLLASLVVGVGIVAVLAEAAALALASSLGASPWDADVVLLAAPLLCLAGCLAGIRLVFPLSELASVRTAADLGLFVAAVAGVLWLVSKFRGWGVLFLGDIGQLFAIALLAWALLSRLRARAFGPRGPPGP